MMPPQNIWQQLTLAWSIYGTPLPLLVFSPLTVDQIYRTLRSDFWQLWLFLLMICVFVAFHSINASLSDDFMLSRRHSWVALHTHCLLRSGEMADVLDGTMDVCVMKHVHHLKPAEYIIAEGTSSEALNQVNIKICGISVRIEEDYIHASLGR